jgi:hypothetical protein
MKCGRLHLLWTPRSPPSPPLSGRWSGWGDLGVSPSACGASRRRASPRTDAGGLPGFLHPHGTPVSAASGGPVSAAADTPAPLGCPHHRLGCQATFLPPVVGANALERSLRLCPHHPPPKGQSGRPRRRCAPPGPLVPVTPNPLQGGRAGERCACGRSPCSRCRLLRRLPLAARGALAQLYAPRPPGAVPVLALQPQTPRGLRWLRAVPALPLPPRGRPGAKTPARPGGERVSRLGGLLLSRLPSLRSALTRP